MYMNIWANKIFVFPFNLQNHVARSEIAKEWKDSKYYFVIKFNIIKNMLYSISFKETTGQVGIIKNYIRWTLIKDKKT